ncbi:MAG: hypothetical protein HY302_16250 [Opitutae bacterium]|nr:hypothetical protein [Opitutae bacterium]
MTGADLIAAIKRQPIGFVCGLVCLVCGLLLYYTAGDIDAQQLAYDQKAAEVARIEANLRNSDKLREQAAAMLAAAKELEARLMRAGQLAINQQYFYRLEEETGVKLLDLRQNSPAAPKTGAKSGLYVGVPYNLTIQGSFPQVLAFLRRLETGRHFSRFNTVSFNKASGSEAAGDSLTVTLAVDLLGLP